MQHLKELDIITFMGANEPPAPLIDVIAKYESHRRKVNPARRFTFFSTASKFKRTNQSQWLTIATESSKLIIGVTIGV